MSKNKDLDEAIEWCKEACKLLKIKRTVFDAESVESKALSNAITAVQKRIKALEKEGNTKAAEQMIGRFAQLGQLANQAVEEQNKELAVSITAELKTLAETSGILTQRQKHDVEQTQAELFKSLLQRSIELNSALANLNDPPHLFQGSIASSLTDAKNLAKTLDYLGAVKVLGKIPAMHKEQLGSHAQFEMFGRKKEGVASIASTIASVKGTKEKTGPAEKKIQEAETLFSQFKYKDANQRLSEAKALYLGIGEDKQFKGELPKLLKLREKLDTDIKQANDALVRSGGLYGYKTDGIQSWIKNATSKITNASKLLAAPGEGKTVAESYKSGITQVAQALKELKGAGEASKKLKKESKGDTRLVLQWQELLRHAQVAHEEMGLNSAAEDIQSRLSLLIATARHFAEADGKRDYQNAIAKLSGYTKLVEEASNLKASEPTGDLSQEVAEVMKDINHGLEKLKEHAPSYIVALQRDTAEKLQQTSKESLDLAILKLRQLSSELNNDYEKFKKLHENYNLKYSTYLADLDKEEWKTVAKLVPDSEKELSRMVDTMAEQYVLEKQWDKAIEILDQVMDVIEFFVKQEREIVKVEQRWVAREQELKDISLFATKAMNFPLVASPAELRDSTVTLRFDIKPIAKVLLDGDLEKRCSQRYEEIVEKFENIKAELLNANLPTDNEVLIQFEDWKKKWAIKIGKSEDQALNALRVKEGEAIAAQVSDAYSVHHNSIRNAIRETAERWIKIDLEIDRTIQQASPDYVKTLHERLTEKAQALISTYETLKEEVEKLTVEEFAKKLIKPKDLDTVGTNKAPKQLLRELALLFDQLEKLGIDSSGLRSKQAKLDRKSETYLGDLSALLRNTENELSKASEVAKKTVQEFVKDALVPKMRAINLGPNYKGYQEKLLTELKDVVALCKSGDASLIAIARVDMKRLEEKIDAVKSPKGEKGEDLYKEVDARIDQLGKMLGTGPGKKLIDYLPKTHAELDKGFNEAIVFARQSSPSDGLNALAKLEEPIRTAIERARLIKDDHVRFEQEVKAIKKLWRKIRKETETLITERVKPLEKYVDARIIDAQKAIKIENGGVNQANEILKLLKGKLSDILTDPEVQRKKLFELNSMCSQEHIEIKTIAQQFVAEVKAFKERERVAVVNVFESRKKTAASKSDADFIAKTGKSNVDAIDRVIRSAKAVVAPYTAMLETLVIKGAKSEPAPDLTKAKAAFQRARQMVADQRTMAIRLAKSGDTPNIRVSGNLKKVRDEWKTYADQFSVAIDKIVDEIRASGEKLSKETDTDKKIDPENVSKAIRLMNEIKGLFPGSAFDEPFKELLSDGVANEKQRLAAREQALRIMRQQRDQLVKNPVLRKLAANPIDSVTIISALGNLRASLLRIEVETLVGS